MLTGEIAELPELFTLLMWAVVISAIACCLLLVISLYGEMKHNIKLTFNSLVLSILFSLGSLGVFVLVTNELATAGVGSFFGEGVLDVTIPGEGTQVSLESWWGPEIGVYLLTAAAILVSSLFMIQLRTWMKQNNKTLRGYVNRKSVTAVLKRYTPFIGIIILIYLIWSIGTEEIIATFLQISPWFILAAAVLTLPRVLLRNLGWQMILKKQHIKVSYWKSLKVFLIGYFYGSITPGYIGQLMRIPYLKDETGEPTGKLFINTVIEEGIHTMSLYLMMVLGSLLIVDEIPEALPIALAVLFAHIIIYWFFIKKERGEKVFRFLIKFLIPKRFKNYLSRFVDSFYTDFPSIKDFLLPFIVVIPTWFIIYTQIYIIALSLGVTIPYGIFILLAAIANIVAFIPITSAGLGTREATMVFLFSLFGVSAEKALVVSLAGHLLTDMLTGFYGFIISLTESRATKKDLSELQGIFEEME